MRSRGVDVRVCRHRCEALRSSLYYIVQNRAKIVSVIFLSDMSPVSRAAPTLLELGFAFTRHERARLARLRRTSALAAVGDSTDLPASDVGLDGPELAVMADDSEARYDPARETACSNAIHSATKACCAIG